MLFEFVKPLVGPKSVQYANGPSGREVHRAMASAFSHQACADALPKEKELPYMTSAEIWGILTPFIHKIYTLQS